MPGSIEHWLETLNLGKLAPLFAEHAIGLDMVGELGEGDLEKLGIALGDRKRLMKAIATLSMNGMAAVAKSPSVEPARALGPEAQRRHLTVMFCDLAGSTALAARLDPEELRALLARYQDACAAVISRHEGYLARYVGDGLLAYFGYPQAHEDDPRRAVHAGLEVVDAVHAVDPSLAVRIGIATGEVVVGDIGEGERRERMAVVGETPNLAARLQGLGEPGSVIVADSTQRLVANDFRAIDLGRHALKGFAEPQQAWRIDAAAAARAADSTPIVGRGRELEILAQAWADARTGRCVRVDLIGEPGIGKSRLVREFLERAEAEAGARLEGHCLATGRASALQPFADVLRRAIDLPPDATPPLVGARLNAAMQELGLEPRLRPFLARLLGAAADELAATDDEVIGVRTREALLALIRERCRVSPTVLFVDDLHWIDAASEELLGVVVRELANAPLLVLCTSRPGYAPPRGGADLALRLEPLVRGDLAAYLAALLGAAALEPQLIELIARRSEGNPLFARALLVHLADRVRVVDGRAALADAGAGEASIPETLAGLLLERVDRLGGKARRAILVAAVVGRSFARALVGAVAELGNALEVPFAELEASALVVCSDARAGQYRFTHALVQEAVYGSLLAAERRRLHEAVARHIESESGANAPVETLAHHYAQTDIVDKAVRYLALAGRANLRVYSLEAAEAQLRRALEIATTKPDCVEPEFLVDVMLDLARVLYLRTDFASLRATLPPYLEHVERLGDTGRLARFLFEIGYANVFSGKREAGERYLRRSLELAERDRDELGAARASLGLAYYNFLWLGAPDRRRRVLELSERAFRAGMAAQDLWLASTALIGIAMEAAYWGRPDIGWEACERLREMSRETDDPRPKALGLVGLALLRLFTHQDAAGLDAAEGARRVEVNPMDRVPALILAHWARLMKGECIHEFSQYDELRRELADHEWAFMRDGAEAVYGLDLAVRGQLGRALRQLKALFRTTPFADGYMRIQRELFLGETFTQVAIAPGLPSLGIVLRNPGFVLLKAPFAARIATRHLRRGLALASEHGAPGHAATCLLNLGLLARRAGRAEVAAARLREAREIAASVEAHGLVARADELLGAKATNDASSMRAAG